MGLKQKPEGKRNPGPRGRRSPLGRSPFWLLEKKTVWFTSLFKDPE